MKRFIAVFSLSPVAAFAHAGGHPPDFLANLAHLVTQPDHLIMLVCATALVGLVFYLRKAGKL